MSDTQPLYKRVHSTIIDRIVSGQFAPGTMLPSEMELAAELGVSQGTARKALMELEQSGVVERHQGRGTFVSTTTDETALFHFFRLRRANGTQAYPEPFQENIRNRNATASESEILNIGKDQVFEIARLRTIDGQPMCREVCVVPAALFPGLMDRGALPNALYTLYEKFYGLTVAEAKESLRAVAASKSIAKLLNVDEGSPVMEVKRRAVGIKGNVLEMRVSHFVTNKLQYDVSLK